MDDSGTTADRSCEHCRASRVKCDRVQPRCGRCSRRGKECQYLLRSSAALFSDYVSSLEADVASLEKELAQLEESDTYSIRSHELGSAQSSPAPIENLVDKLFPENRGADHDIDGLVHKIGSVSLSATTSQAAEASPGSLFRTLLLAAASPLGIDNVVSRQGLPLPPRHIAEQVFKRYIHDVLPDFPFTEPKRLNQYLKEAYTAELPYSVFVVAITLAITALYISPDSSSKAASFHRTALAHLEKSFSTEYTTIPLRNLETVLLLAQYAAVAGPQFSDVWALSGMATRMVVDLGLHRIATDERRKRLFWSAYALDRSVAVALNYPVGLPDNTIDTNYPIDPYPFDFHRLQSEVYTSQMPLTEAWFFDVKGRLEEWYRSCKLSRSISRALEIEYRAVLSLLAQKASDFGESKRRQNDFQGVLPWYLHMYNNS